MGEAQDGVPGTGRIEAFSDGVIAIIVTIMVLELHAPAEAFATGDLGLVLTQLGPKLAVYALSFLVVAVMLINHHLLMRAATRASNTLYWWNAHLLFWMSLIPLCTDVLGESPTRPLAVAFYGAVLAASSFGFTMLHRTAACLGDRAGKLDDLHRAIIRKDMSFMLIYLASVPLAYVSAYLSLAIFVLIPAAYFFPEFVPRLRSAQSRP